MPINLLPASAAAFAPRASPTVVLGRRVEPWLTATLKRVNRVKRPLNNASQHTRCMTETLSSPNAIWTLCSIMFPKAPESELPQDENPLVDALFNFQLFHMEAYVVHVDMVSQNEVAYKLTPETIETLVEFHKDIYSIDTAASTWDWPEKEIQLKKLQEDFVQAANRFVYRTGAAALEGMEEEGAGELLCGRAEDAKAAIMALFVPLLPPPPRIVDVVRSTPMLPSSTGPDDWWNSASQQSPSQMEYEIIHSTPSPASTANDSHHNLWASIAMNDGQLSPASLSDSSFSSATYGSPSPEFYGSSPVTTAAIPLLMPTLLAQQQCSMAADMTDFGWGDRYPDFTLPYGTTI